MRRLPLALALIVSTPALTLADDQASEMARKRFQTFTDIKAIQPRMSDFLPISTVDDWTVFFPPTLCQFYIDGAASKSGESRFVVTCPRFAHAKSALTFRFETRSNTPQTLYLTSVLSDTVDVSTYEYEQFLERPFNYYGSFQSAMKRDIPMSYLIDGRLQRSSGTLSTFLDQLNDDGGYLCYTVANVDAKLTIYCGLRPTFKKEFAMDVFDLEKQFVLAGIRLEPQAKPMTSTKMIEFLRRAINLDSRQRR